MPTASRAEPSPAQTPLVSPPGTQLPVAAPVPTAATETSPLPPEPFAPEPFADELPPDFWGDALEPPPSSPGASVAADERSGAPLSADSAPATQSAPKPLEGSLQKDPRFKLLQELFPGHISDWHAEPVVAATDAADNGADDASGDPETVDLEEGLDADTE